MNAVINMPVAQVATLSSSSILVELNLSYWSGKKTDRKTSKEVEADKGATTKALNTQKILLGDCKEHTAIVKHLAQVRTWSNGKTLPWSDNGPRLLPALTMFNYKTMLEEHKKIFEVLVAEFLNAYRSAIQAAQFSMGSLFNVDDYPDVSEIAGKFAFNYTFTPVPEAGDFRVSIGNQGLLELQQQYETQYKHRLEDAMKENWSRLNTALTTMSNQLRVKDVDGATSTGKLYESTLDGILELCDLLTEFNLTGDPDLEKARRDLKMTVQGIDLKELKKDDGARLAVKAELDGILSKFNW